MRATLTLFVVSAAAGCRGVDPAPEDLDGQFHWFWDNAVSADDAPVHDAISAMRAAVELAGTDDVLRGSVTDLQPEQVEGYIAPGQSVDEAAGFFLVTHFPCTIAGLEPVLIERDQASQYLDIYDRYERVYTSDADAYLARSVPDLWWDIDLTATLLGATYDEVMSGGVRYLPADGDRPPAIVQRTWLLEPADFEDSSSKTFEQDYQLEVYVEVEPGTVMHAYATWREINLGLGFTQDDDVVINTTLNNLEDWDERTSELCQQR